MREMRGWMDHLRSRIPGLSKDLPPRLNMFGEPIMYPMGYGPDTISPFFHNTETKSPAALEAGRLAQEGLFQFNMRSHYGTIQNRELNRSGRIDDLIAQLNVGS
jgi:hypothetical protein